MLMFLKGSWDYFTGENFLPFLFFTIFPLPHPGQRFAVLERKIVLSTLLRRFKFEVSVNTKPPIVANQLVLKSMNGINLIVSRRWTGTK